MEYLSMLLLPFLLGLLLLLFSLGGIVIVQVAEHTVVTGSAWIAKRQEQVRQRTVLAHSPETSLLRSGDAPTSPPEILVRPAAEKLIKCTEELLRVSQD